VDRMSFKACYTLDKNTTLNKNKMNEKQPEKELERVMLWLSEKMRCPLCGFRYNLERIKVIPGGIGKAGAVRVHTDCGECASSLLFALDVRGGEVMLCGIVTDLTYDDAFKFQNRQPLSADDVLNLHRLLADFDGNLNAVLPK